MPPEQPINREPVYQAPVQQPAPVVQAEQYQAQPMQQAAYEQPVQQPVMSAEQMQPATAPSSTNKILGMVKVFLPFIIIAIIIIVGLMWASKNFTPAQKGTVDTIAQPATPGK